MRLRSTSTSSTLTVTTSPGLTTSRGSSTNRCAIAETWTSPSWCTPTSTNAPNAATFVTTPSSRIPGSRSFIVSTPSAKVAVVNSGRGSRPGFSSSARMSVTVGRPTASSTNDSGDSVRSVRESPISSRMPTPAASTIRRTTG